MDEKDLIIAELQRKLDDAITTNANLMDTISDLENELSRISDAICDVYRSI